ncbi:MAG: hypothetical protein A2X23_05410 [Chloroflexi bacterium GWC2_73_18]|nr:MAG: hypothetical protein A2X23_05410 [Chloroflexi bacterium GWC2_73_18]
MDPFAAWPPPLPGPSTDPNAPWEPMHRPAERLGDPYLMLDMIRLQPALAAAIVESAGRDGSAVAVARLLGDAATRPGTPVAITGCGTSEHGAMAAAAILGEAWRRAGLPGVGPIPRQAFEAALDPWPGGVVIGVSHEGGTWATGEAMRAAREAGASVALITAGANSPLAKLADTVLATPFIDRSWCHTVGYLSPVVAAAAIGAALTGGTLDPAALRDLVAAGLALDATATVVAGELSAVARLLVTAGGSDRPAAHELTLKIEEAAWLPTTTRDLETLLHGHLPATDDTTGLVFIAADRHRREPRLERARQMLRAAGVVELRRAAIVSEAASGALPPELTPAGRLVIPDAPALPAPVATLVGTAVPLQLLAYRLALARGTNPDPIRRDDQRYAAAAAVHE